MLTAIRRSLLSIMIFLFAAPIAAETPKVRVTGQGETPFDARQDAVRQVLQMSVEQLVISQQVLENDRMTVDRISSTMNGFVESFDTVRSWREDGLVFMEADVQVSESRIENFIGIIDGNKVAVDSDDIFAAANAKMLAARAKSEIIVGLFQGYPTGFIDLYDLNFSSDPHDSEYLRYKYKLGVNENFKKSIIDGIVSLGGEETYCTDRRLSNGDSASRCGFVEKNSFSVCFVSGLWERNFFDIDYLRYQYRFRKGDVCASLNDVDQEIFKEVYTRNYDGYYPGISGFYAAAFFNEDGRFVYPSPTSEIITEGESKGVRVWPRAFHINTLKYNHDYSRYYSTTIFINGWYEKSGRIPIERLEGVKSLTAIPIIISQNGEIVDKIFPKFSYIADGNFEYDRNLSEDENMYSNFQSSVIHSFLSGLFRLSK